MKIVMNVLVFVLGFFVQEIRADFTVMVVVPKYIQKDSATKIDCIYSLQKGSLYSVKWYKEDSQFYQFIPGKRSPQSYFKIPDVQVDLERSNEGSVYLLNLTLGSSGRYRCEVISEAPEFHTKFGDSNMTVFVPPKSAPIFAGLQPSYQLGSRVLINCSSPSSKPAAILEWYINDEPVIQSRWQIQYPVMVGKDSLETSVLGLRFTATRAHFESGTLRLKCKAQIGSVYYQSSESVALRTSYLGHKQTDTNYYLSTFFNSSSCNIHLGWLTIVLWLLLNT